MTRLNDMMMVYAHTRPKEKVGFYYASYLKQKTMSLHLETLYQLQANRSLLLLLQAAYLSEK